MMAWMLCLFLVASSPVGPIEQWNIFEKAVRDQTIQKGEAHKQFSALYAALKNLCSEYPFHSRITWVFPVQGYGVKDIGAGGFRPDIRYGSAPIKGYDFYDGNLHGGHPALDIFIRDQNQDCLDDRTRQPVAVLAPMDLLILSAESGWQPGSEIRGGNYVWALDPLQDRIFYFAHLNTIRVQSGAFCRAGSLIGTVGRSGKNASPSRSPTHLHLMVLKVQGTELIAMDPMPFLNRIMPAQ
jgi:hypothetical protein